MRGGGGVGWFWIFSSARANTSYPVDLCEPLWWARGVGGVKIVAVKPHHSCKEEILKVPLPHSLTRARTEL